MIIEEAVEGHPNLVKRYSDAGFLIRQDQTGVEYAEAIDLASGPYTYTETDIPVDPPEPEEPDDPEPDNPEPDDPEPDEPEPEPPQDSDDDLLSIYEAYDMLLGGD